jgi:hypothetical protein
MLFDTNIEPSCAYCRTGTEIGDGEIACSRRGIMSADGYCRSFRYEPTKREPNRPRTAAASSGLSTDDFAIDMS